MTSLRDLHTAITDSDAERAVELLDRGVPMIVEHFALPTRMKQYKILDYFIQHGWDINTDVSTLTPSCLVYTFDDSELLDWFLDHGAKPNKRCFLRDCTPLSYAVQDAPYEVIQHLFQRNGSIEHGQLLHYACFRSHPDNLEVLKYIYDKSPNFNATRINQLLDQDSPEDFARNYRAGLGTPLHFAALNGSLECVRFLVEMGADPWIKDPYRKTALSLAVYAKQESVVLFLKDLKVRE
ncbi:hypothetical protein Plec18167_002250 [Paecilomyces lecythidis]|uniref:Ankyrin repeat protein n=1 Tax=Paecilomyces lecythidis TaxID=3004212 RepID=A0ABR3Y996_9EURO